MSLSRFNKSSKALRKGRANFLIARVHAGRPDLASAPFFVPSHGNTAQVVMTADEVFKSAISRKQIVPLRRESAVIDALQGHDDTGVAIPRVTWRPAQGGVYGMTRLQGEPIDSDTLFFLPQDEQKRIAQVLGRFNGRMARVLDEKARADIGVAPVSAAPYWNITADRLFDVVDRTGARILLGEDAWQLARRLAQHVAKTYDAEEINRHVACVHADMHAQNMLYDRRNGQVSLIDLGAGQPLRVEHAFSLLHGHYSKSFVAEMLAAFSTESGITVTPQDVAVYHAAFVLARASEDPEVHLRTFRDVHYAPLAEALHHLEGPRPAPVRKMGGGTP